MSSSWISLTDFPETNQLKRTPWQINGDEFIILHQDAAEHGIHGSWKISKVNVRLGKITEKYEWKNSSMFSPFTTAYDEQNKSILLGGQDAPSDFVQIFEHDIELMNEPTLLHSFRRNEEGGHNLVCVGNKVHLMDESIQPHANHLVCHRDNMQQTSFAFEQCDDFMIEFAAHMKSSNSIILFAVKHDSDDGYSLFQFDLASQKWAVSKTSGIPSPLTSSAFVVNKTEEYIFFFGGHNCWGSANPSFLRDDVHVYDINAHQFRECSLKCPTAAKYVAVSMENRPRDGMLVFGFVNSFFNGSRHRDTHRLPLCIMYVILHYVHNEVIHLIETHDEGHWKINIDHILGVLRA